MITSYDIQISTRCTLHCKHCCMNPQLNQKTTNFKKIQEILNEDPRIKEVHLSGGEPLCANTRDLYWFVKRNVKKGLSFSATTNLIYELIPYRINTLKMINILHTSFDPKIRFDNVKQLFLWYHNLKKIREFHPDIDVFVCLTRKLIKIEPKRISKFFNKLNIDYTIIPLMKYGEASHNPMSPNKLEAEEWLIRLHNLHDKHNKTEELIDVRNFTNCQYGNTMQCINYNGDKVTCIVKPDCLYKGKLQEKCKNCGNLFMCGSSCILVDCYFSEDLYKSIIYNKGE